MTSMDCGLGMRLGAAGTAWPAFKMDDKVALSGNILAADI